MDNYQNILQVLIGLIVLLVAWMSKQSTKNTIDRLVGTLEEPGQGIDPYLNQTSQEIRSGTQYIADTAKKEAKEALEKVLNAILEKIDAGSSMLSSSMQHLTRQIASDQEHTAAQMLGALIELFLLLMFIYADLSLGVNNIASLDPGSSANLNAILPEAVIKALNSKVIALLMASAGSALALGMIAGDLLGLTHLGQWGGLKGASRKTIVCTVLLTFGAVILFSSAQGLSTLARSDLDENFLQWVKAAELLAQGLIIIPLLIATFLLFRGLYGLLTIVLMLTGMMYVVFRIVYVLIYCLERSLALGALSSAGVIQLLGYFLAKTLLIATTAFSVINNIVTRIIQAAQHIVDILTQPIEVVWCNLRRPSQPKP